MLDVEEMRCTGPFCPLAEGEGSGQDVPAVSSSPPRLVQSDRGCRRCGSASAPMGKWRPEAGIRRTRDSGGETLVSGRRQVRRPPGARGTGAPPSVRLARGALRVAGPRELPRRRLEGRGWSRIVGDAAPAADKNVHGPGPGSPRTGRSPVFWIKSRWAARVIGSAVLVRRPSGSPAPPESHPASTTPRASSHTGAERCRWDGPPPPPAVAEGLRERPPAHTARRGGPASARPLQGSAHTDSPEAPRSCTIGSTQATRALPGCIGELGRRLLPGSGGGCVS